MKVAAARKLVFIIAICIFSFSFAACTKEKLDYEKNLNHDKIIENSEYGKLDMSITNLDGEEVRSFIATKGKVYDFDYKYKADSGEIKVEFADSNGNVIHRVPDGKEIKQDKENIIVGEMGGRIQVQSVDEKIKIIITGKSAYGYIKINW